VLISGAETAIDVEDLKSNCRYQGGYSSADKVIARFWKVVASLSASEQALLLRFVTSCQRPPPLGFEQLEPRFCIQRIAISNDNEKLPSAATCFNTLKLPTYSSEKVMKEKLLISISSNSGFELT
jgi:ubiquitin-protein ligase E3 C